VERLEDLPARAQRRADRQARGVDLASEREGGREPKRRRAAEEARGQELAGARRRQAPDVAEPGQEP
jgi:hypothetical protein